MSAPSKQNLITVGVTVVALALGSVVANRLPKASELSTEPIVVSGERGQAVSLTTMTVTVTDVRSAPEVTTASYATAIKPAGRFVVIDLDVAARGKPRYLPRSAPRLHTKDGRSFGGESTNNPVCGPLQPRLPASHCQLLFDADAAVLEGATLVLPAYDTPVFGPVGLETTEIDLKLDAATVSALAAQTASIKLGEGGGKA